MLTLNLALKDRSYPIYIGSNLLENEKLYQGITVDTKVMIVTNQQVGDLYLKKVIKSLKNLGAKPYSCLINDGEQYKNLESFNQVITDMLQHNFERNSYIIALGGGVIGDLAGFVAASYQRGIYFIQIPTSLLAQVDSSVGGKTGVNHSLAKNMIGAFYQPKAVIIDTNTLITLPMREFYSGFGEIIKYGLLGDAEFFSWLEDNADSLLSLDSKKLAKCIYHCCNMKAKIVEDDEKESGNRKLLNLGHTFGHAIESFSNYQRYLHGEAVAIGTMIASVLSYNLNKISKQDLIRIKQLILKYNLPTEVPDAMTVEDFFFYMQKDKKVQQGKINLVLLEKLGKAYVSSDIDVKQIELAIKQCSVESYHLADN